MNTKALPITVLLAALTITACATTTGSGQLTDKQQNFIAGIDTRQLTRQGVQAFDVEIIQQLQNAIKAGRVHDGVVLTDTYGKVQLSGLMPLMNDDVLFIDVIETELDHPFTQCMVFRPGVSTVYPFGFCADANQAAPSFIVPTFTTCLDEKIKYLTACACGVQSPFDEPDAALFETCGEDQTRALQSRCERLSRIGMVNFDSPGCQGQ